jgi:hypothetical protein
MGLSASTHTFQWFNAGLVVELLQIIKQMLLNL